MTQARLTHSARLKRDVPVGRLVGKIVETEAARKNIAIGQILGMWPAICPLLAAWSYPESIKNGTLRVIVGSDAVKQELLYLSPQICHGVNMLMGYEGIRKIMAVTKPMPTAAKKRSPQTMPVNAQAVATTRARLAHIADDELRELLARLGSRILTGNERTKT